MAHNVLMQVYGLQADTAIHYPKEIEGGS